MRNRIYLSSPTMQGEEMKYIQEAFDSNWVAPLGNNVNEFENELCQYVGRRYGAALVSGTAAIHLATKLSQIGENDVVFCQDLTFAATVFPINYEKGKHVFIDSERETWNMSPQALIKAIKKYPNGKAVYLVNLYGVPAKLDEIKEICDEHNLILIEDSAESLGATYKGKQTGTFGKYGIFSFNGNKIITTSGGGMLVSDDQESIEKARFWATQSREKEIFYQHIEVGYNYRMSNIVAGIGRGQLLSLKQHIEKKTWIYNMYKEGFADIREISMNPYLNDTEPNFWLSCLKLENGCKVSTMDIYNVLKNENIESRPIWKPMHLQPLYLDCDFIQVEDKAISEEVYENGLCLPSDIKMTEEDIHFIISIIRKCFGK